MFRAPTIFLLMAGLTCCLIGGICLRVLYHRSVRRYEQSIKASYISEFEARASVAKSLHGNLTLAIERSKSMVNAMRTGQADIYAMENALNYVAEWLELAAEESDVAMRSLEDSPQGSPLQRRSGKEKVWKRQSR